MNAQLADTGGKVAEGLEGVVVDTSDTCVIDGNAGRLELVGLECSECHFLDVPSGMYRHWTETGHSNFTEIFHESND